MTYGGWSESGGCSAACDGMPNPGDPAWHKVTDSHGCSMWSSAGSSGPLCGAPTFDAGHDSGDAGDGGSLDAAGD